MNGVKLQGIVTWFDNFSVLLRRDGHTQLVYKHAISTVMPSEPVQLFEAEKNVIANMTNINNIDTPDGISLNDFPGASKAINEFLGSKVKNIKKCNISGKYFLIKR